MTVGILATPTRTNWGLVQAWRALGVDARTLWPWEAWEALGPEGVAIVRLDVLPTLDGVEPGLQAVRLLEERGMRVLNRADALFATHDKLVTARLLEAAGLPHPGTLHVEAGSDTSHVPLPCVVKPRFGSWGHDVYRCRTRAELVATLASVSGRVWWPKHGALVQELVGHVREDLRVIVAGGRVVGAARRIAAESEWRTNVSVGGSLAHATVPPRAHELAVEAAQALGVDFAGVDLLPADGDWIVLELNGAVDFDRRYTLEGVDPYAAILDALGIHLPAGAHEQLQQDRTKEGAMARGLSGRTGRPGDEIVITGHAVGDASRTAVVLEVLGDPGRERYRVRWEDGHESIYYPADDAVIRSPTAKAS